MRNPKCQIFKIRYHRPRKCCSFHIFNDRWHLPLATRIIYGISPKYLHSHANEAIKCNFSTSHKPPPFLYKPPPPSPIFAKSPSPSPLFRRPPQPPFLLRPPRPLFLRRPPRLPSVLLSLCSRYYLYLYSFLSGMHSKT